MIIVTENSEAVDIQYAIKKLDLNQTIIAKKLEVTKGAVSKAISGNPKVKSLRNQIIQLINEKQTDNN